MILYTVFCLSANRSPVGGTDDVAVQNAQLAWNVSKLKSHICALHPQKPLINEQRLIYGGRLLEDKEKLHEVLREFKPGETQFIHLVLNSTCLRRMESAPSSIPSDGLRHRQPRGQATPEAQLNATSTPNPPVPSSPVQHGQIEQQQIHANQYHHAQYHAMQAMSTAQYYDLYASQLAAAGYSDDVVSPYRAHAQYYASFASAMTSPSASIPTSPQNLTGDIAGACPEHPSTSSVERVPVADTTTGVGANENINGAMNPDAAADNNFAHAGHGARPAFPDRVGPPAANNMRHRVLEQIALVLKLAFFMFYFGSHVGGWRYGALVVVSVLTFLYQGGWVQQQVPPVDNPANDDAGGADVPVPDAGHERGAPENSGSDDNELITDGAVEPVEEGDSSPAGNVEHGSADSDVTTAATEGSLQVPPPAEVSVRSLIGTILYTFFASLVPGAMQRRAANNA